MSNRIGSLKKKMNYISPTNYRPTKEMLDKYHNIWLPLRKKIQQQKEGNNKKFFLIYGDFDIVEIKKNITNPKSNTSSKKNRSNSSTRKQQTKVVKGKKRTWTVRDK